MSPQPNEQVNKNVHTENIDTNASEMAVNLAIGSEDEPNGVSDGSDSEVETEYAGYKLLQPDDISNGCMDSSEDDDEDGSNIVNESVPQFQAFQNRESAINIDINYQNLHCAGVDDFPSTGLGFPDVPNEEESISTNEENKPEDMSDTQVELVINAMAGFSLPSMNIPEWARNLSEDDWQKTLSTTVQKNK